MPTEAAEAPLTRLFVARWPDGTAMIVSADSLADVAGRLDELGDPGTCEVLPLDGPIALVVRPKEEPTGGHCLDASFDALDDALDVQRAIMRAAFPILEGLIERSREKTGEPDIIDHVAWSDAVDREMSRELSPSAEWGEAIAAWWEAMTGAAPDRSAGLRDHMRVTIPGEPPVHPSMRQHFEAEHRRIRQRIDSALGIDGSKLARDKNPKPAARSKPKKPNTPTKKPPRGPGRRRSRR